jgi:hypothetical protein
MKEWLNKNPKLIFPLVLVVFIIIGALYWYFILLDDPKIVVNDFDSCVEANGGVVLQVIPARCNYNGITYTQYTELEIQDPNIDKQDLNLDLPEAEKSQIEAWLEKNGYNQYGDKPDTIYMGGTPLFDESTGEYTKLYDYLVEKYPNKPWLVKISNIIESSNTNPAVKSFAEVKSWQNFDNPNFELQYPDFVNVSDRSIYPVKFTANNGFEFIIDIASQQPNYPAGTCEKKLDIDEKSLYLCYNKTTTYQEIYQRMLDSFVIR